MCWPTCCRWPTPRRTTSWWQRSPPPKSCCPTSGLAHGPAARLVSPIAAFGSLPACHGHHVCLATVCLSSCCVCHHVRALCCSRTWLGNSRPWLPGEPLHESLCVKLIEGQHDVHIYVHPFWQPLPQHTPSTSLVQNRAEVVEEGATSHK